MDEIATPHDTFFRESFGRREIAVDFLRSQLPPALLAELDLGSLEIAKDTYVSSDLRSSYSDLVYRVQHRDGPLHIYLLFEHKSRPEHWTLLQLLRYIAAEGDAYRKQHPDARQLPPVYPMVIYHGERAWQAPSQFQQLVAPLPPALQPFVPQFTYALHDLSARTDVEIKGDVLTRLVQLALRWIFSDQPVARLRELIALIEQVQDRTTAVEVLESLLRYYVQGTQRVAEEQVRNLLQQTATGEPMMQTFIDRYIEQGRQEGWQKGRQEGQQEGQQEGWRKGRQEGRKEGRQEGRKEGRQKGRQEGRQEGEAAVLLRLIKRKFGTPSQEVRDRIASADAETLLHWSERILTADSVESLLH